MESLTEMVRSAVGYSLERQDSVRVEELPFDPTVSAGLVPDVVSAPNPWLEMLRAHIPDALALLGIVVMAMVFKKIMGKLPEPEAIVEEPPPLDMTAIMNRGTEKPPVKAPLATSADEVKVLVNKNNTQAVNLIRAMLN